jgi:tRNA dimethylallyltransferase
MSAAAGPRVVALVGPTAAGKSAAAQHLARRLSGEGERSEPAGGDRRGEGERSEPAGGERTAAEIVAVDAFTIYRGMDIGTATPTPQERTAVPHHLVNELEPEQDCSAQWFQGRARRAIADVLGRGHHALLVGGSGLYFRAVVDPLEFPPTDAEVRAAIAERYQDAETAFAALRAVDPLTASRMDPRNHRRAIRALEVYELTGRPFADWQHCWERYEAVFPQLEVIGVDVARATLWDHIAARVDAMLAGGFVAEAAALRGRRLSRTAAAAIGYAELWDHLAGRTSLAQARERIIVRTRRYAARQRRWFARDPRVRWMHSTDVVEAIA